MNYQIQVYSRLNLNCDKLLALLVWNFNLFDTWEFQKDCHLFFSFSVECLWQSTVVAKSTIKLNFLISCLSFSNKTLFFKSNQRTTIVDWIDLHILDYFWIKFLVWNDYFWWCYWKFGDLPQKQILFEIGRWISIMLWLANSQLFEYKFPYFMVFGAQINDLLIKILLKTIC